MHTTNAMDMINLVVRITEGSDKHWRVCCIVNFKFTSVEKHNVKLMVCRVHR